MKLTFILLLTIIISGCNVAMKVDNNSTTPYTQSDNYLNHTENTKIEPIPTLYSVYFKDIEYKLSKYEPEENFYTGAYILSNKNVNFDISEFEEKVGSHNYYMYNMTLGDDFPTEWVLTCISKQKTPYIVINPPATNSYKYENLEKLSQEFATFNIPIFVEFYPLNEKNLINTTDYLNFYREARTKFRVNADNVAFVWGVHENSIAISQEFYPGDSFCDWVSLTIYQEINSTETVYTKNMIDIISPFYFTYQEQKPIMLNFGVSHFTSLNNKYYINEAIEEIENLYETVSEDFSRIKAILYMDFNGREFSNNKGDDFTITSNSDIANAYKNLVSPLTKLNTDEIKSTELYLSPFNAIKINNDLYLSKLSVQHELNYLNTPSISDTYIYENITYYKLNAIKSSLAINISEDIYSNKLILEIIN